MAKALQILLYAFVFMHTHSALSSWDFAVTTDSKIQYYDDHWQEITSAAHEFNKLSAIAFDETEELIYFNDHINGSIFSLKIPTLLDSSRIVENVVQRTPNETIAGIAYDPFERILYWTDVHNKKIYFAAASQQPQVLVNFAKFDVPGGIAIDICRRKIYWTNSNFKNASIECSNLDGSERKVIVNKDLYMPRGIIVDQLSDRIYWVHNLQGDHFSIESANFDGKDRRVILEDKNNAPSNIAVTREEVFWTDSIHNAIWRHPKYPQFEFDNYTKTDQSQKQKVKQYPKQMTVRGIVARTYFMTNLNEDEHCKDILNRINERMSTPKTTRNPMERQIVNLQRQYCLNGGTYNDLSGVCRCNAGFKGERCETDECFNHCVHGTCAISFVGGAHPQCTCQSGYYGARCQSYKCSGYCLNDGLCKIESSGERSCECKDNFGGQRCEQNSTEVCALFCRILKYEPDTYVPFGCHDICEELSQQNENGAVTYVIPEYKHLERCRDVATWNSTVIIVLVCGVVLCLCLVLLIVHGLRRFYKPLRPRIKKTFVVRRNHNNKSSDTQLTNRSIASEQCEITIENCCNMNICDTPCFDPKLVQQSLSRDNNAKDDKKMLIHNMEDDLY